MAVTKPTNATSIWNRHSAPRTSPKEALTSYGLLRAPQQDVMVMRIITRCRQMRSRHFVYRQTELPERATVRAVGDTPIMEGTLDSGKEGGWRRALHSQTVCRCHRRQGERIRPRHQRWRRQCHDPFSSPPPPVWNAATTTNMPAKSWWKPSVVSYGDIKKEHITEYQKLFKRASLFVGKDGDANDSDGPWNLPTDERIRRFVQNDDPSLASLYYNHGRHLLISSTRPGSLPPNLQGLGPPSAAPRGTATTTSTSMQMNHWPVEQGNLSELHQPLVALTRGLVQSGEATAKAFYGPHARGWVAHMMTNVGTSPHRASILRGALPIQAVPGCAPTCGNTTCLHKTANTSKKYTPRWKERPSSSSPPWWKSRCMAGW